MNYHIHSLFIVLIVLVGRSNKVDCKWLSKLQHSFRRNKWNQIVASFSTSLILVSSCPILFPQSVVADTSTTATTPKQQYFGLKKGRLLVCKSLSNCISTSSVDSIEKYGRPWVFEGSPKDEYNRLVQILNEDPYLKVVSSSESEYYIHAIAKSAVPPSGIDDIEFLINDKENLIFYRSSSRDVVLVYLQQPVSDGGSNRNRLESIKRKLGVKEMMIAKENEDYMKQRESIGLFQVIQEASQPNDVNFLDNSVPSSLDKIEEEKE